MERLGGKWWGVGDAGAVGRVNGGGGGEAGGRRSLWRCLIITCRASMNTMLSRRKKEAALFITKVGECMYFTAPLRRLTGSLEGTS